MAVTKKLRNSIIRLLGGTPEGEKADEEPDPGAQKLPTTKNDIILAIVKSDAPLDHQIRLMRVVGEEDAVAVRVRTWQKVLATSVPVAMITALMTVAVLVVRHHIKMHITWTWGITVSGGAILTTLGPALLYKVISGRSQKKIKDAANGTLP